MLTLDSAQRVAYPVYAMNVERSPLAESIVSRVSALLLEAERQHRPVEMEPYRGQLFELFVTAEAAGLVQSPDDDTDNDAEPDASPQSADTLGDDSLGADNLGADSLCRWLGQRWGLADATRQSADRQEKLPPEHMGKMRLLWSLLRMWMEWQYAWQRWPEFHE